jgi:DNA-binding LacI/PurR family transcriptional regulator
MKRATIADVAKLSGVSISTVSYALSNKRPISEETRLRIREAIQELDYHPNQSAKRLASGEKSRNIGFVLPLKGIGITGLEMKFISGAARAINEAGYTFVLLAHTDRNPENMLRFAQNGVVDGFILMEVLLQDDRVELLKQEGFPFVMVGRNEDSTGLNYVDMDIRQAIEICFQNFAEKRHRSIAYLHKDDDQFGLAVRSVQEYHDACDRYKLKPILKPCLPTIEDGQAVMDDLFSRHPDLNAAFIWNEVSALGAVQAIISKGYRIPEDFSIISLETTLLSNLAPFTPDLIDIRAEEVASQAAKLLIAMLENQPVEQSQILIPPNIITGT